MKKFFIIAVMIFLAAYCFGQNRPRVVVLPLENRAGAQHANDVATLTELVVNFINDTRRLTVIDRFALDAMMTAQKWQMDDWADNNKTAEMGRVLNAQYIVRGTVSTLGSNLVVQARILDINTAEVQGSANEQLQNMNQAYDKLNNFAQNLTSNLGTAPAQQTQPPRTTTTTPPPAQTPSYTPPPPAPAPSYTPSYRYDDEWKEKWFYLGPTLTYSLYEAWYWTEGQYYDYEEYYSGSAFGFGLVADLALFSWLSITAGVTLGFDEYGMITQIPILVRLGGKPGKVEITGNIGYTLGDTSGFTLGATLGFNVGRIGILFFETNMLIGADMWGDEGFMININAGIKFGMGDK
jgi:TolB-like protein